MPKKTTPPPSPPPSSFEAIPAGPQHVITCERCAWKSSAKRKDEVFLAFTDHLVYVHPGIVSAHPNIVSQSEE